MTSYVRLAGLLCVAACGGATPTERPELVASVVSAILGGLCAGYTWAEVHAAKDRDTLVRAIVRQIWTTPIPQSAALSSSRHACTQLRGAIATRVANLEGMSRASVATIAKQEPVPEVASS